MVGRINVELLKIISQTLGLLDVHCFSIGVSPELWVGVGMHPRFADVTCVMTLGNIGSRIFYTMTDGDSHRVGSILAAVEFYGRQGAHDLHSGDSMPMSDPYALDRGRVAAMLMAADLFPGSASLAGGLDTEGCHFDVMSVIFLSADEYALRKGSGAVALIEHFEEKGRDCITFDVRPQST
jgi:hypothetical protein